MNKTFFNASLKTAIAATVITSSYAFCAADANWTYEGKAGPANWGGLSSKFSTCSAGKNQSPIDITRAAEAKLSPLKFDYNTAPTAILNNGHTVQVNIADGSFLEVDGKQFSLKQYHFHTPSENHVNGKSYPFEVHLVHADAQGNLAVVGVFFEYGAANPTLTELWKTLPMKAGETIALKDVATDIAAILPSDQDYYRFTGSLTTPPCSEGVRWFVIQEAVTASEQQVADFLAAVKHENARPIQPVNARQVIKND